MPYVTITSFLGVILSLFMSPGFGAIPGTNVFDANVFNSMAESFSTSLPGPAHAHQQSSKTVPSPTLSRSIYVTMNPSQSTQNNPSNQTGGLGPSAGKVYTIPEGVSIAGYGEAYFEQNPDGRFGDMLRLVLYAGYRFSDGVLFNSEIEFEHASIEANLDGKEGEVSVEFAYLDFMFTRGINFRAGLLLIPLGLVNERHEPTTFYGVRRPGPERFLLPTTWQELGIGFYGEINEVLQYKIYLVNGLDARGFEPGGIRESRPSGNRALFNTIALLSRVDVLVTPSFTIGSGIYYGRADQNKITDLTGRSIKIPVFIFESHFEYQYRRFRARGLLTRTHIGNTSELGSHLMNENGASVGEVQLGGYFEIAYIIPIRVPFGKITSLRFEPFFRAEYVHPQWKVAEPFQKIDALSYKTLTLGFVLRPETGVVLKFDGNWFFYGDDSREFVFRTGIGFNF